MPTKMKTRGQASEVVAALESAWSAIQGEDAKVPDAVIILASGESKGGRLEKWGHFFAKSWKRSENDTHEILVAGEGLARPAAEVFATLLHEAAHARNFNCGVKDCSRQGRYHNARFQETAEAMGLTVSKMGNFGYAKTELTDQAAQVYANAITIIEGAQSIYRKTRSQIAAGLGESGDEEKAADTRKSTRAACQCGRKITVGREVLDAGAITCGLYGDEFGFED